MAVNHAFKLMSRPVGLPSRENFEFVDEPVGEPRPDEVRVRVLYISLDPAMRGWMNDTRSYIPPVGIGEVMRALGLGRVEESNHPDFAAGDHVVGLLGVQERAVLHGGGLTRVDPGVAPLPVHLSALGMTGLTAYFGLLDIGRAEAGDSVVVSGAAGAVGQIVGQIAKLKGARVVGIAGGPTKCQYIVEELGFDVAIDYKREDVAAALGERCPNGIDVYFDNVGGEILDAALAHLARRARVVICGAISQYNVGDAMKGPANYLALLVHHASMTGFVATDYARRFDKGREALAAWLASGELRSREDIVDGLETFPETLLKLFTGDHLGKLMIRVAED
ncbi:MAG: NADP-dependent oxidoreductase [Actinomycetota bacterium]|nr:NADP-dependent oxidoreductase [Actinomycetota bacterium]